MVLDFSFSFNDGNEVLVSRKSDDEQLTVSLELTPLTEPMVYESIDLAPAAMALERSETKAPRGMVFNQGATEVAPFSLDDEDVELDDLLDFTDPEGEIRSLDYAEATKDLSQRIERVQTVGNFNPHPNHKLVSQLVYLHDQDRARELLSKSNNSKYRQLELVASKDPSERGPMSVSQVGNFSYLLYKGVEITCMRTESLMQSLNGRRMRATTTTSVPPVKRNRRKPPGANATRKKLWIDKHRSYCNNGCRHCSNNG
jgi:hypothetical protein